MAFDFIRLRSGKRFHILKPRVEEIDIHDIAWSLSHLCRFTGHTRRFYSVAQHCCHVCDILPEPLKLRGLLHDGSEAYANDIASPVKQYLPQYKELEARIEHIIARRFGFRLPLPAAIKTADLTLLVTEMRDLMKGGDYKQLPYTPLSDPIEPWSTKKARREFMKRFKALSK